jgi:Zn-dependent peptidase ImmA (M78 family)
MTGLDRNRGAKRAREAREALDLPVDAPLECLLTVVEERAQVPVVVGRLPDGVAGACYRGGDRTLLWVNGTEPPARQRFTLAHELGHAWCRHDGRLELDTVATLSGKTTDPYEIQANAFAAEFLVPRAAMQRLANGAPSLEQVVTIAAAFGVSAIVVVYRYKTLRLIGDPEAARLEEQIRSGAHEHLVRGSHRDRLAALTTLPYLSPVLATSQLGAAVRGEVAMDGATAASVARVLSPADRPGTAGRAGPAAAPPDAARPG